MSVTTDVEQGLPPALAGAPRIYLAVRCAALEAKVQALQSMLEDEKRRHERWVKVTTRVAHHAAKSNGFCGVFDQVMCQIGLEVRESTREFHQHAIGSCCNHYSEGAPE